jgi:hypothetical protein
MASTMAAFPMKGASTLVQEMLPTSCHLFQTTSGTYPIGTVVGCAGPFVAGPIAALFKKRLKGQTDKWRSNEPLNNVQMTPDFQHMLWEERNSARRDVVARNL